MGKNPKQTTRQESPSPHKIRRILIYFTHSPPHSCKWTRDIFLLGHSITALSWLSDAHSSGTHTTNASQSCALPAWKGLANWQVDEYVRLVLPLSAKASCIHYERKRSPQPEEETAGSNDCTDDKPFQARGQIGGMWDAGPCGWGGRKL